MARTTRDHWKPIEHLNTVLGIGFSLPVVTGVSYVFSVLGQRVPLISAFGAFGIACCFLVCFLVLFLCGALRAYTKKKGRATSEGTPDKITKIISWKWWPWVILVACFIFSTPFIDTRPRLPTGINPAEITLPIASYREMRQSKIFGRTVVISEVPRDSHDYMLITNKTFEQCIILGPAVLAPGGKGDITQNEFRSVVEKEGMLLETHGKTTVGMIGLRDCSFRRCTFEGISFAGSPEMIDLLRKGIRSD